MHCRGARSRRKIRAEYRLPFWLLRASLVVMYSNSVNGNPEMVIRLINQIPWDVAHSKGLFGHIARQDPDGLKEHIRQGVSTYDVLGEANIDPLTYAIIYKNVEVIRLLLQAGADPYQTNGRNRAHSVPLTVITRFIRGRPEDHVLVREFPISDYLEDLEFTLLHKVVMGIAHISLDEALSMPQCIRDLNSLTTIWISPLQVAALRDDAEACFLLVQAGADVDASHPSGGSVTALHRACSHNNYHAAKALLALGASPTLGDDTGACALHHAAWSQEGTDTMLLQHLIEHGGDVNRVDAGGCSPLIQLAAWGGTLDRMSVLLDRGANIDHQDNDGDTPLLCTLLRSSVALTALLLQRGADVSITNKRGQGVLHLAAVYGSEEGLEELAKLHAFLRGLDINARDTMGKTPRQSFNEREPPPGAELRRAFERLLNAAKGAYGDEEDEEKEFFDARERMEDELAS